MLRKKVDLAILSDEDKVLTPACGRRIMTQAVPKYRLPAHEMAPDTAVPCSRFPAEP